MLKPAHLTAVLSVLLVLWLLGDACAHAGKPDPAPDADPKAWLLNPDAKNDEAFCVLITPGPEYDPAVNGIHCARVGDVKRWIADLKYAH